MLELNEAETMLVARARAFSARHVRPAAAGWERERRMPRKALAAAAGIGLTGIEVPRDLGGQGARFGAKLRVAEAIAEDCMAFAFSLINTQNLAAKLARDGTRAQIERYLPDLLTAHRLGATALTEPGAGSDFSAIATRARKVDGGWRLNGEKAWITNAAEASVFTVYAQTDPEAGWRGIACFLVDAEQPGFIRREPFPLSGGHVIGAGGFVLEDYFVADADLVHPAGEAFKKAMHSINGARIYVAGMCCAMVRRALARAVEYGAGRQTFGQPLLAHQGLRWLLADVATDLEAASLLTDRAAALIQAGDDSTTAAAHAKKFAARMAERRIADCIQAMGANGLREQEGLGRHLSSARIANFVDGSTEMQNERIAAALERTYRV